MKSIGDGVSSSRVDNLLIPMTRLLLLALLTTILGTSLRGESFNPADAEPLLRDRALLLKLDPGTRQARLQVKNEDGEWEVFTVAHLAGDEGFLKMRLPDDVALEDCRAEVSMTDPFPYSFYSGETEFQQKETGGDFRFGPGAFDDVAGAPEADGEGDQGGTPDQVQESDLWQWRGDTLYFFNQARGLQVFDLSEPSQPRKLATLRMPAVGDQMYVLDDEHVLLLANYVNYQAYGWWDFSLPSSSVQQTEAIVVRHAGDQLEIVDRIAFNGDYVESRLVGSRLYLVTRLNEPVEDGEGSIYWRQGLVVNGVDLSDPREPVSKDPLELIDDNGWFWNSVVTASPEHLLVTTSHYDQAEQLTKSRVHVIPIGRDVERLEVAHTVGLKANLPDKFKLRVVDDILTTVTQKNVWREELTTYVESFDLAGEEAIKLDELILAPQERLHATRFDGDRLYVVTFFVELRKDPLFVVSLEDPANLKSLGELEIPGWSTYLVPEDDRLLSVGIEDDRVAISLFDVADPGNPTLVQRVYPGEGQSWSEANWDEKAVSYMTEKDLLLLPIQTQVKNGDGYEYKNLMQIIDVHHDSLTVRGAIEHEVQGRRATALDTHIVSLSGQELLVVDAENRDEPALVATLRLAWDTFKVVSVGDYLWQIGQGNPWQQIGHENPTKVRVTTKAAPDELVTEFEFGPGGVAGIYQNGETLYLARYLRWNEQVAVPLDDDEIKDGQDGSDDASEDGEPDVRWEWVQKTRFFTDVYDVGEATAPRLLGSLEHDLGEESYSSNGLDAVVGNLVQGQLLWRPRIESTRHYGGGWFFGDVAVEPAGGIGRPGGWGYYYGGYPSFDQIRLLLVNVDDPAEPFLVSETVIDPKDHAEFGPMVLRGEQLLLSYKETQYSQETTIHQYKLREVRFTDPANPEVSGVVSLPGILEGAYEDNGGLILFTSAPKIQESEPEVWFSTSNSLLQASAYDGTAAFLVSEVTVEDGRFSPTVVLGNQIFKPGVKDGDAGLLVWKWNQPDEEGELVTDELIPLGGNPSNLVAREGLLFAEYERTLSVIEDRRVIEATFSGPVYTQNLREIAVSEDRAFAWIAVGAYGVESVDLSGLAVSPEAAPLRIAAQVDGWAEMDKERVFYVRASGEDFVGPMEEEDLWLFRSTKVLTRYADWAMAHLNPVGDAEVTITAPDVDVDGDTLNNVVEFVYETSPTDPSEFAMPLAGIAMDGEEITLSSDIFERMGNKDVEATIEVSTDLKTWHPAENNAATGNLMAGGEARSFYRVRLAVREAE